MLDGVFIILSGHADIIMYDKIVAKCGPGDIVGSRELLNEETEYNFEYEVKSTEILKYGFINEKDFLKQFKDILIVNLTKVLKKEDIWFRDYRSRIRTRSISTDYIDNSKLTKELEDLFNPNMIINNKLSVITELSVDSIDNIEKKQMKDGSSINNYYNDLFIKEQLLPDLNNNNEKSNIKNIKEPLFHRRFKKLLPINLESDCTWLKTINDNKEPFISKYTFTNKKHSV